ASSFQEESLNVTPIVRLQKYCFFGGHYMEFKGDVVNWNRMLSRIILQNRCQKRLRRKESQHPKDFGNTSFNPFPNPFHSCLQICRPRSKVLFGRKTCSSPS